MSLQAHKAVVCSAGPSGESPCSLGQMTRVKGPSIGGPLCVLMGARHGHGGVCMSGVGEGTRVMLWGMHMRSLRSEEPSEV